MSVIQDWITQSHIPVLAIVGIMTLAGHYAGKTMKYIRLPSIIGFMLVGVLLGPSLFGIVSEEVNGSLSFLTEIALGFVALSIGLELKLTTLKSFGPGIIVIIIAESFLAFALVTGALYAITGDLPLSLIFGSIAPASAPAGTVAVIQEYRASGSLTKALYAVVGFDDGLGIIIFGFASAIAHSIVSQSGGAQDSGMWALLSKPLLEIGLAFVVGGVASLVFWLLARFAKSQRDLFIVTFGIVLLATGVSAAFHLSPILTNLIIGMVFVNTQQSSLTQKIRDELSGVMPLIFILFFVLAGSNLHVSALPSLGLIGIVYIVSRSGGLMGGAWLGATVSHSDPKIRKYLGLGILSQAGVAIGLSLIVKQEFSELNAWGAQIGAAVITTITATSIIFEVIGPITCKLGLRKAGEIKDK